MSDKDVSEVFSGGHEQVVFCQDEETGLKAIIAVHNTLLGPALGGTRFFPYATEQEALTDVLRLARGMSYKNALAGLDLGGGKAVIIGDPAVIKTEALLRAYGRFVQSLNGRYYTACDVGTYVQDMDVVAKESRFVTGRSPEAGGAGDSSVLTAWGVFQGMRASAEEVWGSPSLAGKRVGVAGVGKVGRYLIGHLIEDGASVVATDPYAGAVQWVRETYPQVESSRTPRPWSRARWTSTRRARSAAPWTTTTVAALGAGIVCGAANNQLAHPGVEKALEARGILYAPDYLVNSGGVIQVADEIQGFDFERAKRRASAIFDTTRRIFVLAREEGVPPSVAADRLAERRMRDVGRLRGVYLP